MAWTVTTYTVVSLVSAALATAVGVAALRERSEPLSWPLAVMTFAVVAWAVPHAISFGFSRVEWVALFHRMQYPGTVLAPVAYLVVALQYADHDRWLSRRTYVVLGVIPVVTVVAVWTNPVHGLFWQSLSIATVDGASVLVPEYGPLYWVSLGYLYLVTAVGLAVLGAMVVRSGPIYRKQALMMLVGGLVPLATNVATNLGIGPDPVVDFTTAALTVTGITFALALFHFDMLDVRPVARDRLVEELEDGVVVVGPKGRVRDFNSTAARVLGDIAVNQPAKEVLPADVAPDGGELVVETETGRRRFRTRSTPLTDESGRRAGRIVYLNDVTDLIEREQRVSVLNRVLRHNIRNELNVVSERLALLEEEAGLDGHDHAETARERTRRVIEFAEKARHIERTLQQSDTSMVVSAAAVTEAVVSAAREEYEHAVVEYESPPDAADGAPVSVVDEELFEMSLEELIENAVVHDDSERPRARVRIVTDEEAISVVVADNGPIIPEGEREVLRSPGETHLEHGSGLGLWLVKWTATLSSGRLTFAENDPRGNVVELSLPRNNR